MRTIIVIGLLLAFAGCNSETATVSETKSAISTTKQQKIVIYQVFTRLFGNTNTTNKPWGTIEENGVGKFSDFTDKALDSIRALGITHLWYTGVPHHAVINDYTDYGISRDDPDVVKGRAGSPYAVKDYYNVNPDLAEDPARRLEEFQALIERTHRHGMKVLIDIVPNHVARRYKSISKPEGVEDFGANDDTAAIYRRDNNFYYLPGEAFRVPDFPEGYEPLGGAPHPLADGQFAEVPARWTGNGARKAQPHANDWYETIKVNYGVRPDGSKDFPALPEEYAEKDCSAHYQFWKDKKVPDSWKKFRDIALYWTRMGVDGFRFDMSEMVPVEFWSYLNSAIKNENPDAFLLAEIYNPSIYRDYIHLGKMDYLYDKVELYDTLKHIMQGYGSTDHIAPILAGQAGIEHHLLHFLENHDEQRIASPGFAGDAQRGKPAMVVSATISTSPTMIYFGQEVGEPAEENPGFGDPTRTSIFDYIGVPHHQRWMNRGAFDGGQLSAEEKALRDFYRRLLNFTINSPAMMGEYADLHTYNRQQRQGYNNRVYSFARWSEEEQLVILSNFDAAEGFSFELKIPQEVINIWQLEDGEYGLQEQIYGDNNAALQVKGGVGMVRVTLEPLESVIWKRL